MVREAARNTKANTKRGSKKIGSAILRPNRHTVTSSSREAAGGQTRTPVEAANERVICSHVLQPAVCVSGARRWRESERKRGREMQVRDRGNEWGRMIRHGMQVEGKPIHFEGK